MTGFGFETTRRAALAALFLFGFAVLMEARVQAGEPTESLMIKTRSGDVTLRIEVARTAGEQARGLMFRRALADDAGMLFAYGGPPRDIHMWMRNTYISLDMLFIDASGRITRIARETEPFSEATIPSGGKVTGVLEIGGGRASALGIRVGDQVVHPHFKP